MAKFCRSPWLNGAGPPGPTTLIRVTESNDVLQGKIEKLFREPDQGQAPKCQGANTDQPVIGMTMLSGLTKSGEEYVDGEITDPAGGKVYRSKAWLTETARNCKCAATSACPCSGARKPSCARNKNAT